MCHLRYKNQPGSTKFLLHYNDIFYQNKLIVWDFFDLLLCKNVQIKSKMHGFKDVLVRVGSSILKICGGGKIKPLCSL